MGSRRWGDAVGGGGGQGSDEGGGLGRVGRRGEGGGAGEGVVGVAPRLGGDHHVVYLLEVEDVAFLLGHLGAGLGVGVEHGEVGHDDGDGQGDSKYSGDGAHGADDHAEVGLGCHVAVSDGGHGDDGPPEAEGNAVELIVWIDLDAFGVVDESGEDDDA